MTAGHTLGALQPDGRRVVEPTFDVVHVAQTIVHVASLPNSVTMLEVNIMWVVSDMSADIGLVCLSFFVLSRATGAPYAGRG
jgi:hypothetical protein